MNPLTNTDGLLTQRQSVSGTAVIGSERRAESIRIRTLAREDLQEET